MEITDVRVDTLQVPLANELGDARASVNERFWVVVELETDTGYTGTGWLGTWRVPDLFERYTRSFADLLVGRDPFATESLREAMRERTLYYPGEIGFSANPRSAIDVACWDLKAQAAGRPLYALLGGEEREIPAYCSRLDAGYDEEELVANHAEAVEDGFDAVKTKVGGRPLTEDVARVRALREELGPDVEILVDANQAWTPAEATRAMAELERFDVGWVEEPVSEFDVAGYECVSAQATAPIATGEMFYRLDRLRQLLTAGAVDVAQHDLLRGGGITGQWDAARLAHAHGVPFAPHIYYELSAHLVSAAPTGRIVEYIPEYDVTPVLENAPEVADGCVHLSDDPGHGYRIDPNARAEYRVTFD
ncbi:mandelate racemase/muconate lactonizing enzyme family protein [Haladaptatus sp. DYSN1]|uniref:mandelate racemase/muconate lactonizing enzyme family protein n=1 Tax=unclassified Haladaptatus TaxID=2622732 RepID=UPI00240639C9|nr:mandelate racemase/muconate lactonizing enzyme family protein [Haladaptatus sp. DYSN1]